MKKLLLCSIIGILALTSCRKDDDTPSIVGVWKESKTLILSAKDGKIIVEETPDACAEKNTYTFTENDYNALIKINWVELVSKINTFCIYYFPYSVIPNHLKKPVLLYLDYILFFLKKFLFRLLTLFAVFLILYS